MKDCKSVERYASQLDPERRQTGACCKARPIPFGFGGFVHDGPCCADIDCGECDADLIAVRTIEERKELLEVVRASRPFVLASARAGIGPATLVADRIAAALERAEGR